MNKILFVCTGNTCRSPLAAAMANQVFNEKGLDLVAESCGIFASDGAPASHSSQRIAQEIYGLDISSHKARLKTVDMRIEATLVVCMTHTHKSNILKDCICCKFDPCNGCKEKTFTFKELANEMADIEDPFSGDLEAYKMCAEQMKSYIDKIDWRKYV